MKKICVVTGSRAEYGLLKPLLDEIKKDKQLKLQLAVTGMHLSADFGSTYRAIERDGFKINEKVDIDLRFDTPEGVARSTGLGIEKFSKVFARIKPDIVVLLGDRFEIFAAAAAAHLSRVAIAHIHGGEVTEGALDDAFRHSITKMSLLHFTAADVYRRRVIQMGESPSRVFNVGAIGLDNLKLIKLLSRKDLEKDLKFKFAKRNLLVTFHPVTLSEGSSATEFKALLDALDSLKETHIIFTKANADTGGRAINAMIDTYVKRHRGRAVAAVSLGQQKYLSMMKCVDAVVGNSSSGIIEAPSFKIGTVNIGDRQKGRVMAGSIIHCEPALGSIRKALQKLYSKKFQTNLKRTRNPHGQGGAARKIKRVLRAYKSGTTKKTFFDIKVQ